MVFLKLEDRLTFKLLAIKIVVKHHSSNNSFRHRTRVPIVRLAVLKQLKRKMQRKKINEVYLPEMMRKKEQICLEAMMRKKVAK